MQSQILQFKFSISSYYHWCCVNIVSVTRESLGESLGWQRVAARCCTVTKVRLITKIPPKVPQLETTEVSMSANLCFSQSCYEQTCVRRFY